MVAMDVGVLPPSIGRVKISDLVPTEGLPSNSYKVSISILTQSLAQYSAVIVELPPGEAALVRASLESARLYFHQQGYVICVINAMNYLKSQLRTNQKNNNSSDLTEWCRTSGYYSDPQLLQETYDYRPGLTPTEPESVRAPELPPSALPDMFCVLGKAARCILDAIGYSLSLRSSSFNELLDNIPLRNQEVSSSVLSVCCHSRPSFVESPQEGQAAVCPIDYEHQVDKTLVTVVKPDKPGLQIKDLNGQWVLTDSNLGPQEVVVYTGLALYQATAGYVGPALHRTDVAGENNQYGRCSVAFKLMPKSVASLSCSEMQAAGYGIEAQFQNAIPVSDFMQMSHSVDQLFPRVNAKPLPNEAQDASMKNSTRKRRESSSSQKSLPPSKRLRLEAQRVLKEKVMEIAEKKGLKMKFCRLGPCEDHIRTSDSPCNSIREALGWPSTVPFVHPHDLPNKAKIAFLEAFEPGWSTSRQNVE